MAMAVRVGRVDERGLVRNLIYLSEACVLLGWMGDLGVEHIHTHYGTNSATVAMLCRLLGGPTYSFTMHGPEEFDSTAGNCLGEKIQHARFVVAICEFTRSQLYRWADYHDWSRIQVIHVGVSPTVLAARTCADSRRSSTCEYRANHGAERPGYPGPGRRAARAIAASTSSSSSWATARCAGKSSD